MKTYKDMEQASDYAERLTIKECERLRIKCFTKVNGDEYFTEEAQDIFNGYYDIVKI